MSPVWLDIVTGRREVQLEFVAAKMLAMRLRKVLQTDSTAATGARCAMELQRLYAENAEVASARRDLAKIGALR
jgi:hypothetical protein